MPRSGVMGLREVLAANDSSMEAGIPLTVGHHGKDVRTFGMLRVDCNPTALRAIGGIVSTDHIWSIEAFGRFTMIGFVFRAHGWLRQYNTQIVEAPDVNSEPDENSPNASAAPTGGSNLRGVPVSLGCGDPPSTIPPRIIFSVRGRF